MVTKNNNLGKNMEKCTGCGACSNICPVSAIVMRENSEGFLFPYINQEICVNCGLCDSTCPVINPSDYKNHLVKIYSASAKDEIRMESSSGGIFPLIANKILEENGVVCGAAFSEDFMRVQHVLVEDKGQLDRLKGSKYVQSSTGECFRKIKEILQDGKKVLFSGTPCQVAGLKSYLGTEWNTLFTVDLICHGTPSPKAYRKYISSTLERINHAGKIQEVNFRKKSEWGWTPSIYIKLEDGFTYSKSRSQTCWYNSFLNGLNCRKSCGECQFNRIPRVGDLTLGDFWALPKEENDGKGVSIITVNNEQGSCLLDQIRNNLLKITEISLREARTKNGNLTGSSHSHARRGRFFKLLNQYDDYNKITNYSLYRKFDIGYVGWWYGKNYGSVLTNFALNYYLESLGYSVLMIEWPEHEKSAEPHADSFSRRFAKKHYEISMRRTYEELPDLNKYCDMFIVGSDQLWNYWSTKDNGAFFFLDFANDSKKKIAYGTSFGHPIYDAPGNVLEENSFHMRRLDYISVREKDGVNICRNTFGVDATFVLDPVFLCDREVYFDLIEEASAEENQKYLFAYILSPTKEKKALIEKVSSELNLKVILILDAQKNIVENKEIMDMPDALRENIELEDWLYYISHAELVITDSYHGLCFSIIFKKQFVCIANIARGLSRFETLLSLTGLKEYLFFDPEKFLESKKYLDPVSWTPVWNKLELEIVRSKAWLINALSSPKPNCASAYDILIRRIRTIEKKLNS